MGRNIAVLKGVGKESLTWKGSSEQRPEREKRVSHVTDWWEKASQAVGLASAKAQHMQVRVT